MYEVYRDHDSAKVGLYDAMLKDVGISTMLGNWNASNITSIPIPELYPHICVFSEEDLRKSRKILHDYESSDSSTLEDWICSNCGETVEGVFSECWSCQTPLSK